jgi:hypothetical protein
LSWQLPYIAAKPYFLEEHTMTKKDFILIEKVLKKSADEFWEEDANATIYVIAHSFAKELAKQNPRFDTDKFIKACGF